MGLKIESHPGDDPLFISWTEKIINHWVSERRPVNHYLIRINNWFDHKWLGFSGIGKIPHNGKGERDYSKKVFRQKRLTFPPFKPARVIYQKCYELNNEGVYEEKPLKKLIHKETKAPSRNNIFRWISDYTNNALFTWFSSNAAINQQGSILHYSIIDHNEEAWYASFKNENQWQLNRTKGVSLELLNQIMSQ